MRRLGTLVASFCLLACSGKQAAPGPSATDGSQPLDIADAALAEGLPAGSLFDFEQPGWRLGKDAARAAPSHLAEKVGSTLRSFPGNVALGPYRLGMTSRDVDAIVQSRADTQSAQPSFEADADVGCETAADASGELVLEPIPSAYQVLEKSFQQYDLELINDAGHARVTFIRWEPAAKTFTMATWLSYLSRTFGAPSYRSNGAGEVDWKWCAASEPNCAGDGETRLPSLVAKYDPDRDDNSLTLSIGQDVIDDRGDLARSFNESDPYTATRCSRKLTDGEKRLLANYYVALLEPMPGASPPIFRRTALPVGLQNTLLYRLGSPDWVWKIRQDYVARYEVGYSRDPASYSETKYVAFAPTSEGVYRAIWQGDGKALHDRYGQVDPQRNKRTASVERAR